MTEGEYEKNFKIVKSWGQLQRRIFRHANSATLFAKSEAATYLLKIPNAHSSADEVKQILRVLDEAKQDFPKLWADGSSSKVLEMETFCNIMKWKEKWFGEVPT